MGDAERSRSSSSSTDSERSDDEVITGGLSSPTKAAVARKTKTKVVDDGDLPRLAPAPTPALESFVNQTAFDVYFSRANRKLHISSSNQVLSALVEPLSKDEYKTLIARSDGANDRPTREIERLDAEHTMISSVRTQARAWV